MLALTLGLLAGWWSSGLLSLSGADDLASTGTRLGLDEPARPGAASIGWSRFLPSLPVANQVQEFEGFQYLGLGLLSLILLTTMMAIVRRRLPWRHIAPLVIVAATMAIYSLSPRVTLGTETLFDQHSNASV